MRSLLLMLRGLGVLIYGASAVVQLNDPDPAAWFSIYAGAAVLVALPMGTVRWWAHVGGATAAMLWALWLLPGALALPELGLLAAEMQASTPAIELARETLGLVMVAGGLAGRAATSRRWAPGGRPPGAAPSRSAARLGDTEGDGPQ